MKDDCLEHTSVWLADKPRPAVDCPCFFFQDFSRQFYKNRLGTVLMRRAFDCDLWGNWGLSLRLQVNVCDLGSRCSDCFKGLG